MRFTHQHLIDCHNNRPLNTIEQMEGLARGMVGVRLIYKELTAENGLNNQTCPIKESIKEAIMLEKMERKATKREKEDVKPDDIVVDGKPDWGKILDDEIPW